MQDTRELALSRLLFMCKDCPDYYERRIKNVDIFKEDRSAGTFAGSYHIPDRY
jgi:hypothetical protein